MMGCEVVFHLAAKATVMDCEQDPSDAFSANVGGTYNVLKTAQELGVRRVIVASSREVYGEPSELPVNENCPLLPKNAYGASKAAAEMYCSWFAASGLEVTALRLSNVFGPGDSDRVIPRFYCARQGWRVADRVRRRTGHRLHLGRQSRGCVHKGGISSVRPGECERCERRRRNHPRNRQARSCKLRLGFAGQCVAGTTGRSIGFVADIRRATRDLGLDRRDDPLAELAQLSGCWNGVKGDAGAVA